jgi:hypothetical protein
MEQSLYIAAEFCRTSTFRARLLLSSYNHFMSIAQISKRCLCQLIDAEGKSQHRDFSLYRDVFTVAEQRILLATALQKLDSLESKAFRRRRDAFIHGLPKNTPKQSQDPLDLFLPDEYYQMEEVCFCCFVLHVLSSNSYFRVTTMASFIISARCMSLVGQNMAFLDFPKL